MKREKKKQKKYFTKAVISQVLTAAMRTKWFRHAKLGGKCRYAVPDLIGYESNDKFNCLPAVSNEIDLLFRYQKWKQVAGLAVYCSFWPDG